MKKNDAEIKDGQVIEMSEGTDMVPETENATKKEDITIFGKVDHFIVGKRKARAEKKAEKKASKKELSKGEKAGRVVGGVAVVGTVLYGVGKVLVNHYARDNGPAELSDGSCAVAELGSGSMETTDMTSEVPSANDGEN